MAHSLRPEAAAAAPATTSWNRFFSSLCIALHCSIRAIGSQESNSQNSRSELNIAICFFAIFLFQTLLSSEHLTKVLTHSISADISFRRHNCVLKPDQRYHSRYGAAESIHLVKKRHKSVLTYTWQYTLQASNVYQSLRLVGMSQMNA